jgi:hypothetical protein
MMAPPSKWCTYLKDNGSTSKTIPHREQQRRIKDDDPNLKMTEPTLRQLTHFEDNIAASKKMSSASRSGTRLEATATLKT